MVSFISLKFTIQTLERPPDSILLPQYAGLYFPPVMRIAEISTSDIRPAVVDPTPNALSQIETSTKEIENYSSGNPLPSAFSTDLRHSLIQLSSHFPFSNSVKLQLWKLSYRLWNACVDISNAASVRSSGNKLDEEHAKIRQVCADLLFIASDATGIPSPAFKCASFYYKTGQIWYDLRKFDFASTCFEKATDITSKIDVSSVSDDEERKLLLDLSIARSKTAWEVHDRNLAITLLNRAKNVLFGRANNYKTLANQFLVLGKNVLSTDKNSSVNEALKLMNEALDLCEKGLRIVKKPDETLALKELRSRTLRFIAASHLQRDEFESVLKCVRVLREGGGENHPSLSVLAMKAWLGLQRHSEAEKELRGMVVNKGIPEGVWVSAVESYFQAVGAAGAETAKGVFLGLLGRCHVSAGATIKVVQRVVGDGVGSEGAKLRAKVVAEVVSDDRVIQLFAGDAVTKERTTMHAVLWNCAADHFRAKDYETSAEMFEKSLLYVPYDLENRVLRAKCFRVLCLCHLALSHLDQAQEYINEAEKLEPNIACAFLKFKICLQRNDHNSAISQVNLMPSCLDFTPDFLLLSAQEATACRVLPVAVTSLSLILNFYSSGKSMPTEEIIVLRTLLTLLIEEAGNETDILKYMNRAKARLSELGPDRFFGNGEVGKRELNWFAVNLWNAGTQTGKANKFDLSAEFFKLASEFYGVVIDDEADRNNVMICKSLILTVSAVIAYEKENKAVLSESEVKQALELVDKAGKILLLYSSGTQQGDDPTTKIEPHFFFIHTLNAYNLYVRLPDTESKQLHIIKTFASSKSCNPKYLLQLALNSLEGPHSNPEAATYALTTCLSSFLASQSPDYHTVALILRKLISVAAIYKGDGDDDDVVYDVYKKAYRIMVGLQAGDYPVQEGKWLAMTAWNRAALPVRLGQVQAAKKWMRIALDLAGKVSGMETYKSCMEDFVAEFDKKSDGV